MDRDRGEDPDSERNQERPNTHTRRLCARGLTTVRRASETRPAISDPRDCDESSPPAMSTTAPTAARGADRWIAAPAGPGRPARRSRIAPMKFLFHCCGDAGSKPWVKVHWMASTAMITETSVNSLSAIRSSALPHQPRADEQGAGRASRADASTPGRRASRGSPRYPVAAGQDKWLWRTPLPAAAAAPASRRMPVAP